MDEAQTPARPGTPRSRKMVHDRGCQDTVRLQALDRAPLPIVDFPSAGMQLVGRVRLASRAGDSRCSADDRPDEPVRALFAEVELHAGPVSLGVGRPTATLYWPRAVATVTVVQPSQPFRQRRVVAGSHVDVHEPLADIFVMPPPHFRAGRRQSFQRQRYIHRCRREISPTSRKEPAYPQGAGSARLR